MPDSADTLRVQRDSWEQGHIALICGIANAGGGVLLVDSAGKDYARGLTRMRKPFEQIPRITQKELGIVCVTEARARRCRLLPPRSSFRRETPTIPSSIVAHVGITTLRWKRTWLCVPKTWQTFAVSHLSRNKPRRSRLSRTPARNPPVLNHPHKTPAPYLTDLQPETSCVALPFRNAPSPRRTTSTSHRQMSSCSAHCVPTDAPSAPRMQSCLV